ncbi:MAG: hypothetical protein WC948_05405 [Thermovirgaceae bacterium]|jgi:hypothetical protein|nr:hypothetical protein [Thermovirga sp.]
MDWKDRFSATVRDRLEESALSVVMREASRQGALRFARALKECRGRPAQREVGP